jgi:uncharacterized protein
VNQKELKRSLDLTVESCVNHVGVDVNTASTELLSYVSGIGPAIALNVTKYRKDNGKFKSRSELKKVAKLGDKAFEQAAGFLRIRGAANPLDNSSIHPETYAIVEKMASDLGVTSKELPGNGALIDKIKLQQYVTPEVGIMTLQDIISELRKPGLDPREEFKSIQFSSTINDLNDLVPGMILTGTITNVANFGVFVDIGVHQDGLIHISKLADSFIKNPYEAVEVGDTLKVEVQEVDIDLNRISLKRISGGKLPDAKPTGGAEAGANGVSGARKKRQDKDDPSKGFSIGSFLENSYRP